MKARSLSAVSVLLLLTAELMGVAAAIPSVQISAPTNGDMLLSRSVDIRGNATGSQIDWIQTTKDDFDTGTIVNLTSDASGTLILNRTLYDDFNDNSLSPAKWSTGELNGPSVSEAQGKLVLAGSGVSSGCYTAFAAAVTTRPASDWVEGTLSQFSEIGSGAFSGIGFYQDDLNNLVLGRGFDFYNLGIGQRIVLAYTAGGTFNIRSLGAITNAPHTFKVLYDGSKATLFMDGAQLTTQSIELADPLGIVVASVNTTDDWVDARWDDVSCYYLTAGDFLSSVYDTLTPSQKFVTMAWTANIPSGAGLAMQVRSADDAALTNPTPWADVTNGQTSGLPQLQRYLQIIARFESALGNATPQLRDITIRYVCGIRQVELSLDNRTSWLVANGNESWNLSVDIPDGIRYIWARATDVEGDIQLASIRIDIDTTSPSGSITINEGAAFTPERRVSLALPASDAYRVASMMVSEDPVFAGAAWQDFCATVQWELSAGDGLKTVYARFRDANGWESGPVNASITLDTLPPSGTIDINGGAEFTRTGTVRLTLNATDESGVSDMLLANTPDFFGQDWLPFAPVYTWDLKSTGGERTVYARFRDPSGHASPSVHASIILDTVPPVFTFTIENGSTFARGTTVAVQLNATDNYRMGTMMLSTNSGFLGAEWAPFAPVSEWAFPPGEGLSRLYARVRDAAENEPPSQPATITVDTVAPVCVISSLPAVTGQLGFTLSWSGMDATSGLLWYDLQYKDGDGPWTDWLTRVNQTTAVFTGLDNHTYTFRSRAQDWAGNTAAYPDNPKTTTTIRLPTPGSQLPVINILTPQSGAAYKGKVRFEGTAHAQAAGRNITLVQWQLDGGGWQTAAGGTSWSFEWDSAKSRDGTHTLRLRSFDGQNYSNVVDRTVTAENGKSAAGGGSDMTPILIVLVVVAAAGGAGAFLVMRRRNAAARSPECPASEAAPAPAPKAPAAASARPAPKAAPRSPAEPGEEGSPDDELAGGPPEAEAAPPGEAGEPAAGAVPVPAGEAAGTAEAPIGEPAPEEPLPPPPAYTRTEAPAPPAPPPGPSPADQERMLKTIKGVFPMLPPELQYMQAEMVCQLVMTGERGRAPNGDPLVLIMGRWYFGNENKSQFLQRFNW